VLQAEGKTVMLITHSVEEAIYLSSRIVVVTARPARIRDHHRRALRLPACGVGARRPAFRRRCARRSARS
jgi:ABC-type nitrate/sulfonate/bicarbonate transport system ATPase subunit